MIFLFLAVISSSTIAMILKFSESRRLNRYAVTSANYVAAFTFSLIMSAKMNGLSAFTAWRDVLWLGLFAGLMYFLGFIFIQKSINENGVGITGAVSKLGIILPVVLSMIVWHEIPNALQSVGVLISVSAIVLINIDPKDIKSFRNFNRTVILLFLIAGTAEFTTKLFEMYCAAENKPMYLFIIFFTAFLISTYFTFITIKQGGRITRRDVFTGFAVGIPNMLTSFFLIESFSYYKASVAFPIYSSGTIVLINIGGYFIFREKLSRKNITAVLLIILAIMLMNFK